MPEPNLRVLIVDDEPLARQRIRELLKDHPDCEVIGECSTGTEAIEIIRQDSPDLVFLDIQMPGLDGLAVAQGAAGNNAPLFVFVTAYDEHAIEAFKLNALDYLLKPFDRDRFRLALERARKQHNSDRKERFDLRILELLENIDTRSSYLDRIIIKNNDRVSVIRVEEIDWIEAEGNYVRIHLGKQSSIMRETLTRLSAQLDPRQFARIHRSKMVNIDRIQEMHPWAGQDWRIILRNGIELPLSRTYRDELYRLLGKT